MARPVALCRCRRFSRKQFATFMPWQRSRIVARSPFGSFFPRLPVFKSPQGQTLCASWRLFVPATTLFRSDLTPPGRRISLERRLLRVWQVPLYPGARMRMKWCTVVFLLAAGGAVACSGDPEAAKRQYIADGDRFMAEKKYNDAALQYRNAVRLDSNFGEGRMKLSESHLATGDGRNALRESVRAADLLPDNVEAQLLAGSLLVVSGQYADGRARALAVLGKEPKNVPALVL